MPLPAIKLIGSEVQPAEITLAPGVVVSIDTVVHAAQEASHLSCAEWNGAITQREREEYIAGKIGTMKIDAENFLMLGHDPKDFPTSPHRDGEPSLV